jgi:hypothetical protein
MFDFMMYKVKICGVGIVGGTKNELKYDALRRITGV